VLASNRHHLRANRDVEVHREAPHQITHGNGLHNTYRKGLALKDKVTSSERTGKKQSTSSERTPQGVQSEPVKGVTVNPKKVIRKVKEKEEEISSSFFVELLVSQYGFDESKFTEKHSAIFDRWELENVTEKEIEGSHAIASKNKGSPNDVTIQYLNGIIFKRREEAKPSKPPPANRPHQTKSTDIENTPEIKAKNDEAHWERMKALGYGEHIHERLQGAES